MTIFATNGAKFYICETPQADEPTLSEYQALTWVEIKELEALGTVGDTSNEVSFSAIDRQRTVRKKGTRTAGTMEVVCGVDYGDAGQQAVIAAEKTPHDHAFKLVLNDAPEDGTPSERYFVAAIGAASEAYDSADAVIKLNVSLWVNSAVTRVDAAEGA